MCSIGCVHTNPGTDEEEAEEVLTESQQALTESQQALTEEPRATGGQWAPARHTTPAGQATKDADASADEDAPGIMMLHRVTGKHGEGLSGCAFRLPQPPPQKQTNAMQTPTHHRSRAHGGEGRGKGHCRAGRS